MYYFTFRDQPVQFLVLFKPEFLNLHSLTHGPVSDPRAKNPEEVFSNKKDVKEKLTCLSLVSKEKEKNI